MSTDIANLIGVEPSGGVKAPIKKSDELGQEEFMRLLVAQLNNQDPTKPMDNFEFLSQIAQFGTVSGIQDMQESLTGVGNSLVSTRAMQASSLAGREVVTMSDRALFESGGKIQGIVDIPDNASSIQIQISDSAGQQVKTIDIGSVGAGARKFSWDGSVSEDKSISPGRYNLKATAVIDGEVKAVDVYGSARVNSVSIGAGGAEISLNLDSGKTVSYAEVLQYM